ncbi:hypothetical protein C0J52_08315 [Blattella germanica]|nr:hypothetical protein C0J52_08315 [Blattella germanica]
MFPAWYPYNYTVSPAQELTNFSQSVASVLAIATIFGFFSLYSTIVAMGCSQFDKFKIMMQAICQKENSINTQNQLRTCIVLHQHVLRYLSKMEEVLNISLGCILFLEMAILCIVAFAVIIAESAKLAAYEVDWIGTPISFQRSILLIISRTSKPFILTAGKFLPVNNATMMNIFNESLSLFMFLLHMKDKHDEGIKT